MNNTKTDQSGSLERVGMRGADKSGDPAAEKPLLTYADLDLIFGTDEELRAKIKAAENATKQSRAASHRAASASAKGRRSMKRKTVRGDSLHALYGRRERASECERWRVDEWCEARDSWWVLEHHETYAKAEAQLDYLMKTCAAPKRRWRVVWIRERVQLLSAESPIDEMSHSAGSGASTKPQGI